MYEFWYDDIYKDIADFEARFDTSSYELNRPLPKGKNKKVIGLMKDELAGKITKKFVALRPKTFSFLIDDNNEDKKQKAQQCVIKTKLKFEDYKNCLEATQLENKTKYLEKNETDVESIKKKIIKNS